MSAPKYEPCKHRHGSGLAGVHHEGYDTPCEHCEAEDKFFHWACIAIFLLTVVAFAIWRYA